MAGECKKMDNLKQAPHNTTMMGVLKGAADYYGLGLDDPMIFGLSGHVFLINIHTQICPSGPYCWKLEKTKPLIENMGLRMTNLGFFGADAKAEARADVERKLRDSLDKGIVCSLLNMENQLITGYDDKGFFTAQPWQCNPDYPPKKLTFGTWDEFGKQVHVSFFTIEKVPPTDRRTAVLASLDYAVDMWNNPSEYSSQAYGVGPKAYDNWIAAIPSEGSGHGNWWNATVWGECRQMAAEYFTGIAKDCKNSAELCAQLRSDYLKISGNLKKASDKAMALDEKVKLLKETKQLEAEAIAKVQKLISSIRAQN